MRRCLETEEHSGRARQGYRGYRGTRDILNPQIMTGTWDQYKDGKGGGHIQRYMSSDVGMRRGDQRQAAEAGGWQVRMAYRWKFFRSGRGVWGQLQERGATTTNDTDGGVVG